MISQNNNTITAQQVQSEYTKGVSHKNSTDLYERVKLCERFYEGNQWDGLKSRTIRPITMNFLKRVVSYFQSMIVSEDIGYQVEPFVMREDGETVANVFKASLDRIIERTKLKALYRESIRDASVDGDSAIYFYFDADEKTPFGGVGGDIKAELLMNTNIIFGNPYSAEVQTQPFLLLVRRLPIKQVREEAKASGCKEWESIKPDEASEYKGEDENTADSLCTEITRFWKEEGSVCFCKVCGDIVLTKPIDTGLSRYPVAYWNWQPKKNSCHGVRPMDEVINTQIAANRMWTAINIHIENLAFPKIVYNKSKFPDGWDASPGRAVATNGEVRDAVTNVAGGVPLNAMILEVLQLMINSARDYMGASDAALGNIKPDNTSAILAVQKASSAPLELQRLSFFQFVEDNIRILIDMMHCYYGQREVKVMQKITDETGKQSEEPQLVSFDFSQIEEHNLDLNVEVGAASYWSELNQITNLNNLLQAQILNDPIDFLERAPKGLVPNMQGLIDKLKEERERAQQKQTQQPGGTMPGMEQAAALMPGMQ